MKRLYISMGFMGGMVLAAAGAVVEGEEGSQKKPVSLSLEKTEAEKRKEEPSSPDGDQKVKRRKIVRFNSKPLPDPLPPAEQDVKGEKRLPLKSILRNPVVDVDTEEEEESTEAELSTEEEDENAERKETAHSLPTLRRAISGRPSLVE